ncbi:type VI secretion system protein TssA [Phaeovulum sp.]|uniref:type VI secretion system protein TssA n=1 Tax=Phaeovulum sp. TaxID=2934796 RepID=UPI0039E51EE9
MNFDRLLAPINEQAPSGVELRHDLRFHDLVRLTEPAMRSARVNGDGSLNDAAPNVDWTKILDDGQDLATEGRDLRLLVLLVRAHYNVEGFEALAQALGFLAQTVTQYWDSLHPALRGRDDPKAAALPRLNALRQLENDDDGLLGDMRFGVLLNRRGIGPVTGDDLAHAALSDFEMLVQAASGLSQAEKDALIAAHGKRINRVKAATRSMAVEDAPGMAVLIAGITACEAALASLSAAVAQAAQFGDQPGLVMPDMTVFLAQCRKTLEQAASTTTQDAPTAGEGPGAPAIGTPAPVTAAPTATAALGAIRSRGDVEESLGRIIEFYERTEPSSPIPHLARRMRRMVAMDFLELMEEIAPSGLKEFRNIAGVEEARKK